MRFREAIVEFKRPEGCRASLGKILRRVGDQAERRIGVGKARVSLSVVRQSGSRASGAPWRFVPV